VARGAAQQEAEIDARRDGLAGRHADGAKPEIAGLGQCAHGAPAVEGQREFARQGLQRAIAEDAVLRFFRQRESVDQLAPIEPRRRARADIPHGVAPAAPTEDAELEQPRQHIQACLRPDAAQLQVAARGDLHDRLPETRRQVRHAAQLVRQHAAARETQPTHEGLFRWRNIKEAVKLVEEAVIAERKTPLAGQPLHAGPELVRRLAALGTLFGGQALARAQVAILSIPHRLIGMHRLGRGRRRPGRRGKLRRLQHGSNLRRLHRCSVDGRHIRGLARGRCQHGRS
jgi:hypothetical protein